MHIAIISTRGIPNNYGGFEEFAQHLGVEFVGRGHKVTVYSPHFHPYGGREYMGIAIRHCYSPEQWMGGAVGSFFYDFSSVRDAVLREQPDIIYVTGYTSIVPSLLWMKLRRGKSPVVVINMDGMEYCRTKYGLLARLYLRWAERMTVRFCPNLIADHLVMRDYFKNKFGREVRLISYGAYPRTAFNEKTVRRYGLKSGQYIMVVCRMEPENNVRMIQEAFVQACRQYPDRMVGKELIFIGDLSNAFANEMMELYMQVPNILFLGSIYSKEDIDALRHYSHLYVHGHTVGGTNPSLLEAMACGCDIVAHDNDFNHGVLGIGGRYFSTVDELAELMATEHEAQERATMRECNLATLSDRYTWKGVADAHEDYFQSLLEQR